MRRIELIKEQIETLSPDEFAELRAWFVEHDWNSWDAQLEADVRAGKLDRLASEGLKEYESGRVRRL